MDAHETADKPQAGNEKYYPTYIDSISFDPKKDYIGLHIVINTEQSNACLVDPMIKAFRDKAIPFKLIVDKTFGSLRTFYAVLDFTGKSQLQGAMEKELRTIFGSSIIVSLEFTNTLIPGLVYNSKSFPLLLEVIGSQIPVTGFTHPFLGYMFRAIYETFGVGGLSIIWLSGREAVESMRQLKNLPLDAQQKMSVAMIQLQLLGWGKFELGEMKEKSCSIRAYDNFECLATKDLKGYQTSFMRGVFTGLASTLADKKGNCIEKKCIKKGDPYCEFSLE